MIIYYLFILVAAVMLPKKGKCGSNRTATAEDLLILKRH
jgi:hypothetical protein